VRCCTADNDSIKQHNGGDGILLSFYHQSLLEVTSNSSAANVATAHLGVDHRWCIRRSPLLAASLGCYNLAQLHSTTALSHKHRRQRLSLFRPTTGTDSLSNIMA
jgi:hypothetical protein